MSQIKIVNLQKSFGDFTAVKNSNLTIKGNNANEELTTPTGACILVNLTDNSVEHYPSMNISSIGYGAGPVSYTHLTLPTNREV